MARSVDVTVDIAHPTADQLDMYLVAPSGRTIANDEDFAAELLEAEGVAVVHGACAPPSGSA